MAFKVVVPIALVIALAGCGSFGAIGLPWKREKPVAQDETLPPPAPTAPVQSSDVGPPGDSTVAGLRRTAPTPPASRSARRPARRWRRPQTRAPTAASAAPTCSADGPSRRAPILPALHDADELDGRLPSVHARLQQRTC
ncbi:MAG: hypothetical protein WDM84_06550 [Bauldia sp.]